MLILEYSKCEIALVSISRNTMINFFRDFSISYTSFVQSQIVWIICDDSISAFTRLNLTLVVAL